MKPIILTILFVISGYAMAETRITHLHSKSCVQGVHEQPGGVFAVYVFCDDALGTNIAVFLNKMGAPIYQDYDLGNRFWQNQEWSYDVVSFAWLPGDKIILSTSGVYGSGSVYLLDPRKKETRVLLKSGAAVVELDSISGSEVKIRLQRAPNKYEYKIINMQQVDDAG